MFLEPGAGVLFFDVRSEEIGGREGEGLPWDRGARGRLRGACGSGGGLARVGLAGGGGMGLYLARERMG